MSRTYKDKPARLVHTKYNRDDIYYIIKTTGNHVKYLERGGILPKRRKEVDTEWHWMTTPGWWIRLTMNRPQRRRSHQWEHMAVRGSIDSLEDSDPPLLGKKPFVYFW